jgi:hypothetical protein
MYTIIVEFTCDEMYTYASDFNGLFYLMYALNSSAFVKHMAVLDGSTTVLSKDFNWSNIEKWTR